MYVDSRLIINCACYRTYLNAGKIKTVTTLNCWSTHIDIVEIFTAVGIFLIFSFGAILSPIKKCWTAETGDRGERSAEEEKERRLWMGFAPNV